MKSFEYIIKKGNANDTVAQFLFFVFKNVETESLVSVVDRHQHHKNLN